MQFIKTKLRGVIIVDPIKHGDNRGYFMEVYNESEFEKNNLYYKFVQDNQSFSSQKGTLRGLHFQNQPYAQAKLMRCNKGKIIDVAVDIKKGSATYLQTVAVELSEDNKRMLMIPKGYAHGFVTIEDDVEVIYKVDNFYNKDCDRGIRYDDPEINFNWLEENPILSAKDIGSCHIKNSDCNFTIKVLVTGVNGQLGYDVVKRLSELGLEAKGVDINDFDITDERQVFNYIKNYNPDVVVHCAAYTAVDKAENDEEKCFLINKNGTENIAKAVKAIDASMVYISTDYVYGDGGNTPHSVDSKLLPLNVYGKSKLAGERAAAFHVEKLFIVRTSWVFGKNGNNFVKTMLRLSGEKDNIEVVADQIGSPTYTVDLAKLICEMIQTEKYGIYHGTNCGYCSWYDFAKKIFDMTGKTTQVTATDSESYKTAAKRPQNSRMDNKCLTLAGFEVLPHWESALERYIKEIEI